MRKEHSMLYIYIYLQHTQQLQQLEESKESNECVSQVACFIVLLDV